MGSPMYAELVRRLIVDLDNDGPVRRILAPHADAPGPAATALRLLGTVHRLVLEGRADGLAPFYPSVGGQFSAESAWPQFVAVLDQRASEVAEGMRRPPQTNEVGRAAALVGGLLRMGAADDPPLRLFEIGASAGLNLRADRFRYRGVGGFWGPANSRVRLDPAWEGAATPVDTTLQIVERRGCDLDPVDPTTSEGRLRLASYVWPDHASRLSRLRGACDIAGRVPAEVRRESALAMVSSLNVAADQCTVVWHSVMWQYLDEAEQDAVRTELLRLGSAATDDAPVLHLSLEPRRRAPDAPHTFLVVGRRWPGGQQQVLGQAPGHGVPVRWER
jgi:hypothetical protein